MIAYLKGTVAGFSRSSRLLITTTGGVGYVVEVHPSMMTAEGQAQIAENGIAIWHVCGEDHQTLYGFRRCWDREVAERIREVQGMGPVSSARLVQASSGDEVLAVIATGDAKALARMVTGLGAKRAQQIITEMQDYAKTEMPGAVTLLQSTRLNKLKNAAIQLGLPVNSQLLAQVLKQHEALDDANVMSAYMGQC